MRSPRRWIAHLASPAHRALKARVARAEREQEDPAARLESPGFSRGEDVNFASPSRTCVPETSAPWSARRATTSLPASPHATPARQVEPGQPSPSITGRTEGPWSPEPHPDPDLYIGAQVTLHITGNVTALTRDGELTIELTDPDGRARTVTVDTTAATVAITGTPWNPGPERSADD